MSAAVNRSKNVEDIYPLSSMQEGVLFHTLLNPDSGMYLMQDRFFLEGEVKLEAFVRAWEQVLSRHGIFRTSFVWKNHKKPLQVVHKQVPLPFEYFDWRDQSVCEKESLETTLLEEELTAGLDFSQAPLMRLRLIRLTDNTYRFIRSYQLILMDAWCFSLVMADFLTFYKALLEGREIQSERPRPYRDYIGWLQRQDPEAAELFWRDYLRGLTQPTCLVGQDSMKVPERQPGVADQSVNLSVETTTKLLQLTQRYHLTLNTFVQGAWALLLSRYSGKQEVSFGVTVAGRPTDLPGAESIVGLFINSLPLRVHLPASTRLVDWLKALLAQNVKIRQFEYAPLVQIHAWSQVPREQALFESILVFENAPLDASLGENLPFHVTTESNRTHTNYPLTVVAMPSEELGLQLTYDQLVFDDQIIGSMLNHFKHLLQEMASHPESCLGDFSLLTQEDQHLYCLESSHNNADYPLNRCVHELFEAQVVATPEKKAVQCAGESLTYCELNQRANQVAHALIEESIGPDTVVGVLDDRGLDFMTMLLGIFKAGGAYLPFDVKHPRERWLQILKHSRVPVLVVGARLLPEVQEMVAVLDPAHRPRLMTMKEILDGGWSDVNQVCLSTPAHLAYVIFTSGSTGIPKGAMIEQQGMVNNLWGKIPTLNLTSEDVIAQTASAGFDISVWQCLTGLLCGGRVEIIQDDVVQDPERLLQELEKTGITIVEMVPSLLQALLALEPLPKLAALRWLLPTGEALPPGLCREWLGAYPHIPLLNVYGPAECSDDVTVYPVRVPPSLTEQVVPIGRPVGNMHCFVVDPWLNPLPVGVFGELALAGVGVGRGYLEDAAQTAEAFIPHPFSVMSGARLYRTGDRVKYQPDSDGCLEFWGRLDHQVKVRGFRIELGEIEARLIEHPEIREAVVLAREDQLGDKRLVAYVVSRETSLGVEAIRIFLQQTLPNYMIPSTCVFLDALPVTPNGKIDRKALPIPENSQIDDHYIAPRTAVEEILVGIWTEVLGDKRIGLLDNFFELGGHSLLATQVMSRLRTAFQIELPLRNLFDFPTVEKLAGAVERTRSGEVGQCIQSLVPIERKEYMPVSFAQQRLWFLAQLEPDGWSYNIPFALRLVGTLDISALVNSFNAVVHRHESLRTTFHVVDGQPVQRIALEEQITIPVEDLSKLADAERHEEARRLTTVEMQRPFRLDQEVPIRLRLLRLKQQEHVLSIVLHHIAADAWSIALLAHEVAVFYEMFIRGHDSTSDRSPEVLPNLPIQYADFAHWQRQWLQGDVLETHLSYWKQQLGTNPPVLRLPCDRPRPSVPTYRGAQFAFSIPLSVTQQFQTFSRQKGCTLFMSLLAAFKVLLFRTTGQEDILVGTDVANRNREETEGLIGFFINLLPLRTDLSGNPIFTDLLKKVRSVALEAYAHQDLPFEKVVESLKIKRDLSSNPLVQTLFVLQNVPESSIELPGLDMDALDLETEVSRFDLALFMEETEEGLSGTWKYSTDLFNESTIVRLSNGFMTLLERITAHPEIRIQDLDTLSDKEKESQIIEQQVREEAGYKKFKKIKPKVVNLTQRSIVHATSLNEGGTLPLVIQPAVDDVDFVEWANTNREYTTTQLNKFGAILFRGFSVKTVSQFEQAAQAMCPELFGEYGDLPREVKGQKVYGSTPYPDDQAILFHNESSHLSRWPLKQWFCCLVAAREGGETPIVDCRQIYRALDPELRERFEQKQLLYVRNFIPNFDVSWQAFFKTTDHDVVEEFCRNNGVDFTWLDGGGLRTSQVCPAMAQHPKTGEWVFFNQIQLHHISCLEASVRGALVSMMGTENVPRNVYYGDGSPLEDEVVWKLRHLYEEAAVRFAWQDGDLLMVDNMLVAHGRDPFEGSRKIVVAMGEMVSQGSMQTAEV